MNTRDHSRTLLQLDLVPRSKKAETTESHEDYQKRVILDTAEYLAMFPENDREVRARAKADVKLRVRRAGVKPESLGTRVLSETEHQEMLRDIAILEAGGEQFVMVDGQKRFKRLGVFPRDCPQGVCVKVSCRHNLLIEVREPRGEIPPTVKLNFPGRDPAELYETCSIRYAIRAREEAEGEEAADGAVASIERVSRDLNLTPERVRQIEKGAFKKIGRRGRDLGR